MAAHLEEEGGEGAARLQVAVAGEMVVTAVGSLCSPGCIHRIRRHHIRRRNDLGPSHLRYEGKEEQEEKKQKEKKKKR